MTRLEIDSIFKKKFNVDSLDAKAVLTFTSPKNVMTGKNYLYITFCTNAAGERQIHKITFQDLVGDFLTEEFFAQQII